MKRSFKELLQVENKHSKTDGKYGEKGKNQINNEKITVK